MSPVKDARELAIVLRIIGELELAGNLTATVDSPGELLAWTLVLPRPRIVARRGAYSGHRYLHVTARHGPAPGPGRVTAVLACEGHRAFWDELGLGDVAPGDRRDVSADVISWAWQAMPVAHATSAGADEEISRASGPER